LFCFSRGFGKIYKIAFKKSGRNRLARGKNGKGPAKNEKQRQRFSMPYKSIEERKTFKRKRKKDKGKARCGS